MKKHLSDAIDCLIDSWGGDTPPEAFWVMTHLVKYINAAYNQSFDDLDGEEMTEENRKKLDRISEFLS